MSIPWRKLISEINTVADSYLLAISGGVDSMFLLDFFINNCNKKFFVAHFDHGLRPESKDEADMVQEVCRAHGVPFVKRYGDVQRMLNASSLEAEARRQRYEFLEYYNQTGGMIVTGHHANDQMETVILRLMRGYPDDSLRMKRVDGSRYKPFLLIPKEDIIKQAKHRNLRWMEDASNECEDHERNWVRNNLVPQMMERRNVLKTIGLKKDSASDMLT